MPARHGRPWRGLAAAAALVAAACSDSTGPQAHLASPQQLSSDLQAVSGVLQSSVFQSFGAVGTATGSPAAASTPAGALLVAAPIVTPRTSGQAYADAPRRLQALRLAARTLGSGISASVIPSTVLGKTFVWDVGTHQYVEDATATPAAPTNGARIILYEVNVSTGTVIEPTTAVGYVDLLDESTTGPAVDKLHVIVKDGTPASPGPTTYADYTISGSITGSPATAFNASAVGFVSDGTHTLSFNASFTATNLDTDNPDAQIDVTWDLDNPVVHVELHEAVATADVDHATITINFSVTRGTETVSVSGTVTVDFLTVTATVNITVQVNGVAYARITGPVSDAQRRHANGSAVSAEEDQALFDLFLLPLDMEIAIESLFTPSEHLMGG